MMLTQAPPPTPKLATTDPVTEQIQKLMQTEAASVGKIVELEGKRAELKAKVARTHDSERQTANAQLAEVEGLLAGERAKATELQARIGELQGQQFAMGSPAPVTGPSYVVVPPTTVFGMNKEEATVVFGLQFVVLVPLMIVLSRWLWRRTSQPAARQPAVADDRMERIERAVEAVAIEVERIGESQRFQAKLMSDKNVERAAIEPR